jgi:hypothetical protein
MKYLSAFLLIGAVLASLLVSGCAGMNMLNTSPATGFIYMDYKAPMPASTVGMTASGSAKVGEASASSILGWVGTGDCSIEAAMKAGGITKVHHVDYHATRILGLFATYTTIVYGE